MSTSGLDSTPLRMSMVLQPTRQWSWTHWYAGSHITFSFSANLLLFSLSSQLDDKPVQHREVMDNESTLFKSYFKRIELLEGG